MTPDKGRDGILMEKLIKCEMKCGESPAWWLAGFRIIEP